MATTFDFDNLRNLTIGTVDFVAPNEIKVLLETDAPENTALNTGIPSLFPRINGYVLIPNEVGALVGIINYLAVEHSQYPKRKGFKDYDLIDLPFPLRKMSVNPVGTLKQKGLIEEKKYQLERGVYAFPSIGDTVILPTEDQLAAIVENKDENAVVTIGKATLAGNAEVRINPDKLFGRHLAVLGNTGSGKSCTVAGLIRWSLEVAKEHANKNQKPLNARFIILDPNGEYSKAFEKEIDKPVRKFQVKIQDDDKTSKQLKIPAWMWNSHEWISFSQAAPGAQRPLLLRALADLKKGHLMTESLSVRVLSFLSSRKLLFQSYLVNMPNADTNFARYASFIDAFEKLKIDLQFYQQHDNINDDLAAALNLVFQDVEGTLNQRLLRRANGEIYRDNNGNTRYTAFANADIEKILASFDKAINTFNIKGNPISSINPDTPTEFDIEQLTDFLLQLAESEGGNVVQFVHMLSLRMRFLVSDERLKSVVNPKETISLTEWLNEYIGKNDAEDGQIVIIDLSLIPSDVIHIVVAVLSRLTFEAVQRYRRENKKELPTVMVLEEAHSFIKERKFDETNYSSLCLDIFERIAREGRKFGLSMVLSSQRPSELSPTVLSQCNTFILHRIVNDKDQELVKKLVPDNVGSLLKELPVLPTRKAILLGWASPIPILVELKELHESNCPHSNDPKFWDVWVGNEGGERIIDWKIISDQWQGATEDIIEVQKVGAVDSTTEEDDLL